MVDSSSMAIGEILQQLGKLTSNQIKEATASANKKRCDLEHELQQRGWISADDLNHARAMQYGMKIQNDLSEFQLKAEVYEKIPYAFAKKHSVLPIQLSENKVIVAVADPLNLHVLDELRFIFDCEIDAVFSPKEHLMAAISLHYEKKGDQASDLLSEMSPENARNQEETEVYDLLEDKEHPPVIQLLNLIMTEAIQQGASDIHFEPFEHDLKVRYRIDGVLHTRHSPPQEYQTQLLTRLKVMAKLDIAERRLPQDGRIKLKMGGREIDFRASTIPVVNGERIVLRILDKGNIVLGINRLGLEKSIEDTFKKLIRLPEGIVLVTGPTGSGKTTTLYSALKEIASADVNVMTIEDPVEYKLPGIAQIAVHHKINLDFATGLRHILRQDPDVIMVGEIRDQETAEVAIQAALTGHLVLSTLHTNDAPSSMARLVDMGIEPYLLSSSVAGVLAQRLVRTICPNCRTEYSPTKEELEELELEVDKLYRGDGCTDCFGSGYKGRHGVYELMPLTHKVKRQLTKNADAQLLRKIALEEGMISLRQSGAYLVKTGLTTVEEVLRVTRGAEEKGE